MQKFARLVMMKHFLDENLRQKVIIKKSKTDVQIAAFDSIRILSIAPLQGYIRSLFNEIFFKVY